MAVSGDRYEKARRRIVYARKNQTTTLRLGILSLTTLPESIGELTQLRNIELSSNNLSTLPEWIGNLTRLQSLDLIQNKLRALPESFSNLTQLEELDLDGNPFNAQLESAYKEGIKSLFRYLKKKSNTG